MSRSLPTVRAVLGLGLPVVALLSAFACGGGSEPATPAATEAPAAAAVAALPDKLDFDNLNIGNAGGSTLVPSPRELQAALGAAGLQTTLASLVPARTWKADANDTDRVAVRTGVVIADLLLTVTGAEDAALIKHLTDIRAGMSSLDAGSDIDATLADLIERVKAGAIDRDTLLGEFDDLSQVAVPELEFHGNARIVPLIKAGSWLAGANLVARAAQTDAKPAAVDGILKQPEVVGYFKTYVKEEGADKVTGEVAAQLDTTLSTLDTLARKEGSLSAEDIASVVATTNDVLGML